MSALRLSLSQRIVVGCALIGLAVMFLIVPYQAVWGPGDPDQVAGPAGYHLVFSPPDAVDCTEAVGRSLRRNSAVSFRTGCRNYLNTEQLVLSVFAYACGVISILILMAVTSKRGPLEPARPAQFRYGEGTDAKERRTVPSAPTPLM